MLKLKNITKTYISGDEKVNALKGIDIEFRKSEFVSILGQSGCGKTTLLNIIGGLDRYTSGDLIINGKSTKEYKDRDWDLYRNYSVGFVFQSYNLIPHQSVLDNVELALTISGYSKEEKRAKAIKALKSVGLEDKIHKKPSQLSGGQMQRVAIARAIVNDPDIILADEPTGALDTKTSIQIMDLLKEISKDKLIIMVTHNPDLAEKYSNRIVKLVDGKVTDDSNPYDGKDEKEKITNKNKTKTHMKFTTALRLSLNNLMTKKGRTILTAFAGSIGIIGIALILSLSSGMNEYITDTQKSTMISYPISIEAETIDVSSILSARQEMKNPKEIDHGKDAVYSDTSSIKRASTITTSLTKNNLTEFKKYLESENCEINNYVGEQGIVYSYDTKFDVYTYDKDGNLINTNGSTFEENSTNSASNETNLKSQMPAMSMLSSDTFEELISGKDDEVVSNAILDDYDVIYGQMPKQYNEIVLILDKNNEVSATTLYNLGLLPSQEYKDILEKINNNEDFELNTEKIDYENICNQIFKLMPACDYYVKDENGLYKYIGNNTGKVESLLDNAMKLKITGIIRQKEDSDKSIFSGTVGYTKLLTNYIIEYTNNSEVVKAQETTPEKNVITGLSFKVLTNEEKANEIKEYLSNLEISQKAEFATSILQANNSGDNAKSSQIMSMSETQLANQLDQYLKTANEDVLVSMYDKYISAGSYDDNMKSFGKVELDAPSSINIYADTFEDKDAITDCIEKYNETANENDKITYTDYVGLLMSSVTTIIDTITYVLIAFVSISLIVSSIMIAIITYISVLERTKEIGILRAMGTSKNDVSKIFNAETFIEGLVAGLLGVGITVLLNIPINMIIKHITGISGIASLPLNGGIILVIISVILTVIAGLVPAKLAAKKDPAVVLRSE